VSDAIEIKMKIKIMKMIRSKIRSKRKRHASQLLSPFLVGR